MNYRRRENKVYIAGGGQYSTYEYVFTFETVEMAKEAKKALKALEVEHPDFEKGCEILAAHGGKSEMFGEKGNKKGEVSYE